MLRTEDDLKSIPYSIRTVCTIQDSPVTFQYRKNGKY